MGAPQTSVTDAGVADALDSYQGGVGRRAASGLPYRPADCSLVVEDLGTGVFSSRFFVRPRA